MKRTTVLVVFILLAAVLMATALFALNLTRLVGPSPGAALASNGPSGRGPVPGEAALRATINPETGRVDVSPSSMPTNAALDEGTLEALRRDTEGLKQTFHPNGAVSVDLQGRFQSVSVARIGEDGKVVICTEDVEDVSGVIEGRAVGEPAEGQAPEVR